MNPLLSPSHSLAKKNNFPSWKAVGLLCAVLASVSAARSETLNFWDQFNGSWSDNTGWSLGHSPLPGENAIVRFGPEVLIDSSVDVTIASLSASEGSSILQTGGKVTLTGPFYGNPYMLISDEYGAGTFTMTGGEIDATNGRIAVGYTPNGANGLGVANISGGTITHSNEFWVGQGAGSNGTLTLSGNAQINGTNWFAVGREGGTGDLTVKGNAVINKSGSGNLKIAGDTNSIGTVTVSESGQFIVSGGSMEIGQNAGTVGTVTIKDSGSVQVAGAQVRMGGNGSTATLNLDGGSLAASWIEKSGGAVTVNFNGGTLIAQDNGGSFMAFFDEADLHVLEGGFKFDSNGFDVTVVQGLSGAGSVTKLGTGNLTLGGLNSYLGDTFLEDGVLTINTASLGDSTAVYIAMGGIMNLAYGTDTDTVNQLWLNGSAVAPGVWGSMESDAQFKSEYFAGTGTLTVLSVPEPTTVSLTAIALVGLGVHVRRRRAAC